MLRQVAQDVGKGAAGALLGTSICRFFGATSPRHPSPTAEQDEKKIPPTLVTTPPLPATTPTPVRRTTSSTAQLKP